MHSFLLLTQSVYHLVWLHISRDVATVRQSGRYFLVKSILNYKILKLCKRLHNFQTRNVLLSMYYANKNNLCSFCERHVTHTHILRRKSVINSVSKYVTHVRI